MDDLETGTIVLGEKQIQIDATSLYDDLKASTNYAKALALTDIESYKTIGTMGLYASWNNTFDFSIKLANGNEFLGNTCLSVKIDNEFGNSVLCHSKLNYQDGEKKYIITLQEDGFPFRFIEQRGNYKEEIVYNIFNTWGTCTYMHHQKFDKFTDGTTQYDYVESSFITEYNDNKNNIAVSFKQFGERRMSHSYQEFTKVSNDDEDSKEVINKGNFMHLIDPTLNEKIKKVTDEFSVDGNSFLENMILYSFTNYSHEEVNVLFGFDKKNIDLEKAYFGYEDAKTIGSKKFVPENLGK